MLDLIKSHVNLNLFASYARTAAPLAVSVGMGLSCGYLVHQVVKQSPKIHEGWKELSAPKKFAFSTATVLLGAGISFVGWTSTFALAPFVTSAFFIYLLGKDLTTLKTPAEAPIPIATEDPPISSAPIISAAEAPRELPPLPKEFQGRSGPFFPKGEKLRDLTPEEIDTHPKFNLVGIPGEKPIACMGALPSHGTQEIIPKMIDVLMEQGVTTVVDLMQHNEATAMGLNAYQEVAKAKIPNLKISVQPPVPDGHVAPDPEVIELINKLLIVIQYETIYIHCWGGNGRTSTIAVILLAAVYPHLRFEEILEIVFRSYLKRGMPMSHLPEERPQFEQMKRLSRHFGNKTESSLTFEDWLEKSQTIIDEVNPHNKDHLIGKCKKKLADLKAQSEGPAHPIISRGALAAAAYQQQHSANKTT